MAFAASYREPGCCTEFGLCGSLSEVRNTGCTMAGTGAEGPRLCRRANKNENIGVDPLLDEVTYFFINEAGQEEIDVKEYGNCDGPIRHNNSSYYYCQGPLEWNQARAACEWKKDRYLVHIDDAEENNFLHDGFQDDPFWIGAYNDGIVDAAGFWRWSDTESPFFQFERYQCQSSAAGPTWEVIDDSYVNWAGCDNFSEEPQPFNDEGVEENCAQMRADGYWSEEECALQKAYVCEEQG